MLKNGLIIVNPKYIILDASNQKDVLEIKRKENNTYLSKIIGYDEKTKTKNSRNNNRLINDIY